MVVLSVEKWDLMLAVQKAAETVDHLVGSWGFPMVVSSVDVLVVVLAGLMEMR